MVMVLPKLILVTGATGAQGGAVADILLGMGASVRAMVRDPSSSGSQALAKRGVELVVGDFDDEASLAAAMTGVTAVFSMQLPPSPQDPDSELRTGRKLVAAALAAAVTTFVHTSVARADEQQSFLGWAEGRWDRAYWDSKSGVNDSVRSAGFPHWAILKPAFMMENYIAPKARWMFSQLADGYLTTAMTKGARLDLVAASDIGRLAAAVFGEPGRFNRQEIPLAAQSLDTETIAQVISRATGKPVVAKYLTVPQALEAGMSAGLINSQEWASVEGYKVDIEKANSHRIVLMDFDTWALSRRDEFMINTIAKQS
jgi:uncharacterized protein YbjT (DUF2867 family)